MDRAADEDEALEAAVDPEWAVLEWVVRAWVDSVAHGAEGEVFGGGGFGGPGGGFGGPGGGGGFGRQGGGMGGGGPMGMMNGEKELVIAEWTVPTRNAAVSLK